MEKKNEKLMNEIREAYQKAPYHILSTVQLAELGEFHHILRLRREMYGDGSKIISGSIGFSDITIAEIDEDGWLRPADPEGEYTFFNTETNENLSLSQAIEVIKNGMPIGMYSKDGKELAVELICYE